MAAAGAHSAPADDAVATGAAWLRGAGVLAKDARAAEAALASLYAAPALGAAGLRFDAKKDRSGQKDVGWLEEVHELYEGLARERAREGRDLLSSVQATKALLQANLKWLTPEGQAKYGFSQTRTAATRFLTAVRGLKDERRRQYAKLASSLEQLEGELGELQRRVFEDEEAGDLRDEAVAAAVVAGGAPEAGGLATRAGHAAAASEAAQTRSAPGASGMAGSSSSSGSGDHHPVPTALPASGHVSAATKQQSKAAATRARRDLPIGEGDEVIEPADEGYGAHASASGGGGGHALDLEADPAWLLGGEAGEDASGVEGGMLEAAAGELSAIAASSGEDSRFGASQVNEPVEFEPGAEEEEEEGGEEEASLAARLAAAADACRAGVAELDAAIARGGGDTGGWPADDHRVFVSLLTSFLSKKGRAASIALAGPALPASAADADGLASAPPPPLFVTPAEEEEFTARLATALPVVSAEQVQAHLQWYHAWVTLQRRRRAVVAQWSRLRADRARLAGAEEQGGDRGVDTSMGSGGGGGGGAPVRPTSPGTRARLAAWREARDAEKAGAAAAKAAEEAARRTVADAAKEAWRRQQRAALEEWSERKQCRVAWADRLRRGGGGSASMVGDAGGDLALDPGDAIPPSPEELARRAKASIAAAVARRTKAAALKAAAEEAAERRFGKPGTTVSQGTAWTYSYVPHDPEQPTTASAERATSQHEVIGRIRQLRGNAAHAAPVASQQASRGRSYAVGASGTLPSRATPAWMKR